MAENQPIKMAPKAVNAQIRAGNKPKIKKVRSTAEKVMLVLGVLIALSMIVALFGSFGGGF